MNKGEVLQLINKTVDQCTKFFIKNKWVQPKWHAHVRVSFSPRRSRSWGGRSYGRPFVSLSVRKYTLSDLMSHMEYRSFEHDEEIGNVRNNSARALVALVIHEMCHAVQFTGHAGSALGIDGQDNGHGLLWKQLYRRTRNALLNHTEIVVGEVKVPGTNTMKRAEALKYIKARLAKGLSKAIVVQELVNQHGFKKSTAMTYTYSC